MFEQDYLMKLIMQLVTAIRRSLELTDDDHKDPESAIHMLTDAIGTATDMEGSMLLKLAPESFVSVLQVSGMRQEVASYVGHALLLLSEYQEQLGDYAGSRVRALQAQALCEAFGFDLDPTMGATEAMEAFLAEEAAAGRIDHSYED